MQEFVSLAPLTTLGIGGPARFLARITTEEELLEAIGFARSRSLPLFVLGGGSNLLVSDAGFDGMVVQIALTGAPEVEATAEGLLYTVPAGNDWDGFVRSVCEQGVGGVECLAGIPGLVGGTPVQNVGAYGQEVAETITAVRALDLETLEFVALAAAECGFRYRQSRFNGADRGRYVVTAVTFRLQPNAVPKLAYADLKQHFADRATQPTLLEVYHAVRSIRQRKGMLLVEGEADCRSAGSFFKNPVVAVGALDTIARELQIEAAAIPHWPAGDGRTKLPAAWLLERAGFVKGYTLGRAGISSRHTLALINRGDATAAEIAALRERIQQTVAQRFGIQLEQEPVNLP
jgi:UDP-N-acetylmuramate dehydrogenase